MKLKLISRIGYWIIIVFLAIVAGTVAVSALNLPQGIKLYTVQSGSMAPTLPVGSLVVVKPQESYQKGEIITFKSKADLGNLTPENTTTHRIADVKEEEGEKQYITKGDANDSEDADDVIEAQVIGKKIFSLPWVGHVISFAKTREGLIVLIVIPAVIIVYSEILNIKKELVKIYKKIKEKDNEDEVSDEE